MGQCSNFALIPILTLAVLSSQAGGANTGSRSYRDTRQKLVDLVNVRLDTDKLASLFNIGDKRIVDLVRALDDGDKKVSLNAQVVIRYLGNDQGMRSLYEWYKKQQSDFQVAGPVPLPLSEWDYNYIKLNCVDQPVRTWRDREVQYIHALALDGSPRAREILPHLIDKAKNADESSFVSRAIKSVEKEDRKKFVTTERDPAVAVLRNAFFIAPVDQRYASARLLAFNATKSKALVELHIGRGDLAEEWYHAVITRHDGGWAYFSVYQVGIS